MSESLTGSARRHVREGKERIARQQQLVAELAHDGHQDVHLEAAEVLAKLERQAEQDLEVAIYLAQTHGE